MTKKSFLFLALVLTLFSSPGIRVVAQESAPNIRVVVDMVQLNVAVTDNKGNYVTGLHPSDFAIVEDSIPQKLATFGEGNEPAYRVADTSSTSEKTSAKAGRTTTSGGSQVARRRRLSKFGFNGGWR